MNQLPTFNQITLITDGCSNQGISPIEAAREALRKNIIVNVIGITDGSTLGSKGQEEIKNIAIAGGGLHQIVPFEQITKTVQMVTKQAVNKTIQQVVHTQLTRILGKEDLTSLPPDERIKVVEMMDNMAEHGNLNILLLIDQSTSMFSKMKKVEEAILDFQLSLSSRAGRSLTAIVTFPGELDFIDIKIPWTSEIRNIDSLLYRMRPQGNTPTGPAIQSSISYISRIKNKIVGMLDEYII